MTKPGRNKACPCESGKKYKHCCAGKPLVFERTSDGRYSIGVPLSRAAQEVMERSAAEFAKHFERPLGKNDPIFLAKYLASSEDIEIEGVKAMQNAGIPPALIYAYKKTGYILTEENSHIATGAAIQEWNDAIREFEEHGDPSLEKEGAQEFDELLVDLTEDVESCFYALGLAADHFFNVSLQDETASDTSLMYVQRYQSLCAARAHRTLRSISTLLKSRFSEDALKLGRAVYECYLHMVVVQEDPTALEVLVDVPLGLHAGTHGFKKTTSGREDRRVVVELSSRREVPSAISAFQMAARSPLSEDREFFDYFYRLTSELIHPSVLSAHGYFSDYGIIDPVKIHLQEEAVVFCTLVGAMTLDRVVLMQGCPDRVARDCTTVSSRIQRRILRVLQLLEGWCDERAKEIRELRVLRARCARLAEG
jgi:hypothetical protein